MLQGHETAQNLVDIYLVVFVRHLGTCLPFTLVAQVVQADTQFQFFLRGGQRQKVFAPILVNSR